MRKWRRFIRSALFFAIFLVLLPFWKYTLACLAFLMLSVFYFGVDVYSIDKRKTQKESVTENYSGPHGILGDYIIESTKSYGLFIELLGAPVFIDIKQDKFLEQRKQRAIHLFENQKKLEINLVKFINQNAEFKTKKIDSIGLHYIKNLERGEVFWDPDGYTLLYGLEFVLESQKDK